MRIKNTDNPLPECEVALHNNGLVKEVYEFLKPWTLRPESAASNIRQAIFMVSDCMERLNQTGEQDEWLEQLAKVHADKPLVLRTIAERWCYGTHYGSIIDDKFIRGNRGGRQVDSQSRDWVRAMQLMVQGMKLLDKETIRKGLTPAEQLEFYNSFDSILQVNSVWKLQILTDLSRLPDYEEGRHWPHETNAAPVDAEGNPVFYKSPKSFDVAASDGERWISILDRAAAVSPEGKRRSTESLADFAHSLFGVQTLSAYDFFFRPSSKTETTSAIWSLETLEDDETIAKLANGIKRFKLPEQYCYLKIWKELYKESDNASFKWKIGQSVANEYVNRRQFPKAAAQLAELLKLDLNEHERDQIKEQYEEIVGNRGTFDPLHSKAAGSQIDLVWLFRNGTSLQLTAERIDIPRLMADIEKYLKSLEGKNPDKLDHERITIENIGYKILMEEGNTQKYLGEKIAEWQVKLEPAKNHFMSRAAVPLPFDRPGAWLVRATMVDGNSDAIVVWINDTAIVEKPQDKSLLYYVADAKTGKPLPEMNLNFFGFGFKDDSTRPADRQSRLNRKITLDSFSGQTDSNGLFFLEQKESQSKQWRIIARSNDSESPRFAWYGFKQLWFPGFSQVYLNRTKAFFVSDRPVYRPEQKAEYKIWLSNARYDMPDTCAWAGKEVWIQIRSPRGTTMEEKTITLDEFGGYAGTLELEKDAMLGPYSVQVRQRKRGMTFGHGTFRVEEYKKPEYEVAVEAPKEPVSLGEVFNAKITAKYYFGAPVTDAMVKYTVTRQRHTANWYPIRAWDWFYGNGYWWFASDYDWYPGWHIWGCPAPRKPWFPFYRHSPPEMIASDTVPIGPDGTVEVKIDSAAARDIYPNDDQAYSINVEVTDQSRRTITGNSSVLVSRKPFRVYTWLRGGFFEPGRQMDAAIQVRRLDGKPVSGNAELTLYQIAYRTGQDGKNMEPVETRVWSGKTKVNDEGKASAQLLAGKPGQYRFSAKVTDSAGHTEEGAYIFTVRGTDTRDTASLEFNALELIPDREEYAPGQNVKLLINTKHKDSTVLLFARSIHGVCSRPQVFSLDGKSRLVEIKVETGDIPNFFIEALTVSEGNVYTAMREIVVPPEKRILNVEVLPSKDSYRPGEKAKAKIRVTDRENRPISGQAVVSIYDKSVEYISGSTNVPDIREYFWKWQRSSSMNTTHNLARVSQPLRGLRPRGLFDLVTPSGAEFGGTRSEMNMNFSRYDADESVLGRSVSSLRKSGMAKGELSNAKPATADGLMLMVTPSSPLRMEDEENFARNKSGAGQVHESAQVEPTIREKFADTAYWNAALNIDANGTADIELAMPENLTAWKIKVWTMSAGTKVGQGEAEVMTKKNLLIRMQKPRFLVQGDTVVLSANVHNYLKREKKVRVQLEFPVGKDDSKKDVAYLKLLSQDSTRNIVVPSGGEQRVDWNVRADAVGKGAILMKAITDEESDAVLDSLPILVHGIHKQEAVSVTLPAREKADGPVTSSFTMTVPEKCRPDETKMTIRFSPTLAGAILDAVPYLTAYPYGCTEQTLNRFLPTVMIQKALTDAKLDLEAIASKRNNLNAQELGNASQRAGQWQKFSRTEERNPVFDPAEVRRMTQAGIERLTQMQCSDGGWAWFSGYGARSDSQLTALVVRGLKMAIAAGAKVDHNVFQRGVDWLVKRQKRESEKIINGREWSDEKKRKNPNLWKENADNTDAFVWSVLVECNYKERKSSGKSPDIFSYMDFMKNELWSVRAKLSLLCLAQYGLALSCSNEKENSERIDLCIRMISQFLKEDSENQTAWLDLPGSGTWHWWRWYGDEFETQAAFLKLIARHTPKSNVAPRMVKYLLNNRKNATYWNSTRDTACCIEAFLEYIGQTNEFQPDTTIRIALDGKELRNVKVDGKNLFTFDNTVEVSGPSLTAGTHRIDISQTGGNPLYCNAYLEYFTTEDRIAKTGLEVKIERRYYLLEEDQDSRQDVVGGRGQAVSQRVKKYKRTPLADLADVKSGQLIAIELIVESKNDYESLLIEDNKPAGFEPVETQSGYSNQFTNAYVEYRDDRVCFFVHWLPRGKYTAEYRVRAEQPGRFSALPAKIGAMYAPELKGNSDEFKTTVRD